MKKAVKVLHGIVAAGASASAAALAVKKYMDSKKVYVCDEDEEDDSEDEDIFGDDPLGDDTYDFGNDDQVSSPYEYLSEEEMLDMGSLTDEDDVSVRMGKYLTADQVDFIGFMLKGITNIGTIMDGRISDVDRICRRHITAAEKVSDIRNLCFEHDDSKDLLDLCVNDIREVLSGGYPHDYFDYVKDRKDGKYDGE